MIRHQRSAQNAIDKIVTSEAPHADKVGELLRIREYADFWIGQIETMEIEYTEILAIHKGKEEECQAE